MNQRFQIEDLIVQDATGVVFHALDLETGQPAAVRRLFPFGVNGGGLDEEEQVSYQLAIDQISPIKHPALRANLLGGVDPVDGLPYLATEWVEGATLQSFIDNAPLSPAEATYLLTQALEICELLSHALGREAIWVETQLSTIVVGAADTGRGFTFWVAPMKWLGKSDGQRGLEPLVTLVEEVLGWRGKAVADHDGGGLGAWLKWLRLSAGSATFQQAREKLAQAIGVASPSPVRRAVRQAGRPVESKKLKRKSSVPFFLFATTGLAVLAGGGFALVQWNERRQPQLPVEIAAVEEPKAKAATPKKKKSPKVKEEPTPELTPEPEPEVVTKQEAPVEVPAPTITGETAEQRANRQAMEFSDLSQKETHASDKKAAQQKSAVAEKKGVFTIADSELLVTQDGKQVSLEGTLKGFKKSTQGKTLYLLFSETPERNEARGSIFISKVDDNLSEDSLKPLIGKKMKISGKLNINEGYGLRRLEIEIKKRADIELK